MQQFPRDPFKLENVLHSVEKLSFESSQLNAQYNEKKASFTSALVEVSCRDLTQILSEGNCSVNMIIKQLVTEMDLREKFKLHPICFESLGFSLHGDTVGAKLCGSQFQLVPRLEGMLNSLIPNSSQVPTAEGWVSRNNLNLFTLLISPFLEVRKKIRVRAPNLLLNF